MFEPGGSMHQFNTPADNTEDTDALFVDDRRQHQFRLRRRHLLGIMDAGWIKAWGDQAIKDQGADKMNYISAGIPTYTR